MGLQSVYTLFDASQFFSQVHDLETLSRSKCCDEQPYFIFISD